MRGDGSIQLRGRVYWLKYRGHRRSAKTGDPVQARAKLPAFRREVDRGDVVTSAENRVLVGELLDDLVTHLTLQKKASARKLASHVVALKAAIGKTRAATLQTSTVERITSQWLEDGKAPATVSRRLEALRQAYNFARKVTPPKVRAAPYIPLPVVDNARQGFLSRADFLAILAALRRRDPDVADFVEWFFWTSMRPGEIRQLEWSHYDAETAQLHVPPAIAKTRTGRSIAVQGPLLEILKRRQKARRISTRLIFHRVSRGQVDRPVRDFRALWRLACADVGLVGGRAGVAPYDLRRTGLRNIVRATGSERAAMAFSGHKTRRTFDRYNIHSDEDQRGAMDLTASYVATLPTKRKVTRIRSKP